MKLKWGRKIYLILEKFNCLFCISEYRDNFFLLCVNNDYATLLELSSKTEAISTISKNYLKKTNHVLKITFGQG
jgi:hypothetical protein